MKTKILYQTRYFDVIQNVKTGRIGLAFDKNTVGILPYTIADDLLESVGLLYEYNPFRPNEYSETLITGTQEPEDDTLLHTAIRELEEEAGITCTDVERWIFLGSFRLSKSSNELCHVYGVNVTDLELKKPKGDGSKDEKLSKFSLKKINDAIITDEAIFLASFLRLFDFFYQKNKK